jgi:hypothetical protein
VIGTDKNLPGSKNLAFCVDFPPHPTEAVSWQNY